MMSAPARKLGLLAHVVTSVGWLGAVATSLVLGIVGLVSGDASTVRAVYLTMDVVGWPVLVPLSLLSLATGLVQALGTRWGLLRHYWVIFKLGMNLLASVVLLLYMQTLDAIAEAARASVGDNVEAIRSPSPVVHGGGAVALLLVATILSIYKPPGRTGLRSPTTSENMAQGGKA